MNEENLNELKEVLKEVSKDEEYEEYVFFDEMEKIKKQNLKIKNKLVIEFICSIILAVKIWYSTYWSRMIDVGYRIDGEDIVGYEKSKGSLNTLYIYYIIYFILLIINPILYNKFKNKNNINKYFILCNILEFCFLILSIIYVICIIIAELI